jgi:hypothetical protein
VENSLSARLFQKFSAPSSVSPFSGSLLAYEVPLCDAREGQLKIDLLACGQSAPRLEIIELKQANGHDSPLMALVECICYGLQLWRCREEFRKECGKIEDRSVELQVEDFKNMQLTIAAPQQYWDYWECTGNEAEQIRGQMQQILDAVSEAKNSNGPKFNLNDFFLITPGHISKPA